jgi:hypothetical protein
MTAVHIEGRPVSAATYQRHGCRCDGCRALAVKQSTTSRANRANLRRQQNLYEKARRRAMRRLSKTYPVEFKQLLVDELARILDEERSIPKVAS